MDRISLDEATMAFQRSSLDSYCLPLARIAALRMAQMFLRWIYAWAWSACVDIRLDTSFLPYFAGTKFRYIWRKVGAWRPAWPCIKTSFSQIYVWLFLVGLVIADTEGNLRQINALIFSDISE